MTLSELCNKLQKQVIQSNNQLIPQPIIQSFNLTITQSNRVCCRSQKIVISTKGRNLFRDILKDFSVVSLLRNDTFRVMQQTSETGHRINQSIASLSNIQLCMRIRNSTRCFRSYRSSFC